jgi:hypothetical protein
MHGHEYERQTSITSYTIWSFEVLHHIKPVWYGKKEGTIKKRKKEKATCTSVIQNASFSKTIKE